MNILIVDNYQPMIDDLKNELKNIISNACCIGTTHTDTILPLFQQYKFDIAFLDIEMSEMDGISLAKMILAQYPRTNIIYITKYPQYALESYDTYASAFLLKPLNAQKLADALRHLRYPVIELDSDEVNSYYAGTNFIGKRIESYRKEQNISRQALARQMDVSLQTIYRWEHGERTPDIFTIIKLSKVFQLSLDQFLSK